MKEVAIVSCETAHLPDTVIGGDVGNRCRQRIGGSKCCTNPVEGSPVQVLHRRHAEVLLKCVAKGSLRNTRRGCELLDRKKLSSMLINKLHRRSDDLVS